MVDLLAVQLYRRCAVFAGLVRIIRPLGRENVLLESSAAHAYATIAHI